MSWVFLNREFIEFDKAFIPIHDRGFLFGDGVFTTAKIEQGHIHHWDKHDARLLAQCKALQISPPNIQRSTIDELIKRNHAFEGIWKLKIVITGGSNPGLSLPRRSYGTFLMTLDRYQVIDEPVGLCLYPYLIEMPMAQLKTLSYLHRLMVKQYALDQGMDDAVVCSSEGWVLESAFSNIYWKENDKIVTPSQTLPLLPGTYLSSLENFKEERITYTQLREKKDVYLCNAMCVRSCFFT